MTLIIISKNIIFVKRFGEIPMFFIFHQSLPRPVLNFFYFIIRKTCILGDKINIFLHTIDIFCILVYNILHNHKMWDIPASMVNYPIRSAKKNEKRVFASGH